MTPVEVSSVEDFSPFPLPCLPPTRLNLKRPSAYRTRMKNKWRPSRRLTRLDSDRSQNQKKKQRKKKKKDVQGSLPHQRYTSRVDSEPAFLLAIRKDHKTPSFFSIFPMRLFVSETRSFKYLRLPFHSITSSSCIELPFFMWYSMGYGKDSQDKAEFGHK